MSAFWDWLVNLVASGAILIVLLYFAAPVLHLFQMWEGRRQLKRRIATGKLNPKGFQTHLELGEVYTRSRMWSRAARELAQAVEIEPEHAHCRSLYGRSLFHLGRFQEAAEHLEKALAIRPEEGYGQTQVLLGRCYEALQNPDKAEEWYRAAMARNSSICEPGYRLGALLKRCGNGVGAKEEWHQSRARFSSFDRANYWKNLYYSLRARVGLLLG